MNVWVMAAWVPFGVVGYALLEVLLPKFYKNLVGTPKRIVKVGSVIAGPLTIVVVVIAWAIRILK
jgi:hypothetical protein